MSAVFGESGPKHVEVLNHPTRRQSRVGGPPMAATVGEGTQQPPQNRTLTAVSPAVAPQLSSQISSSTSSTVSCRVCRASKCRRAVAAPRTVVGEGGGGGVGLLYCRLRITLDVGFLADVDSRLRACVLISLCFLKRAVA